MNRSRGLVSALRASFVVNLNCVAIQRSNAFENSGEPVRLTVPQPNSVESERHLGLATQASTVVHARNCAFDNCVFVLTRLPYGHTEPLAWVRLLRSQMIVQNRYQRFTVSKDEFTASRVCITEDRTRIVVDSPLCYSAAENLFR